MNKLDEQIQGQTQRLNHAFLKKYQAQQQLDIADKEIAESQTFLAGIQFAQQNQDPPDGGINEEGTPA